MENGAKDIQADRPHVIEMDGVAKEFRRGKSAPFLAVTDLHVTVADAAGVGEFICVIGPSGCGKSTVLQLIAGFDTHIPPTRGEVRFCGAVVDGPSADRGMLFQSYGCYPHLTVVDNIAFGLSLHSHRLELSKQDVRDMAREWLTRVRLGESDACKYPHELSGGMRQRVALARCLALKPRCVLMDEPFSALDEPTRFGMQDLIVDLWSEVEATVVLVSHSVAEAVYLGDRVWIMSGAPGTIVREFASVPMPDPDVPAMVTQSRTDFAECVGEVTQTFFSILSTPRDQLSAIHADGSGQELPVGGQEA